MKRFGAYASLAAFFLFLLTGLITFVIFFTPLYRWCIDWFDLSEISHLDETSLMENYRTLISYLTQSSIQKLSLPDFPSSTNALLHFAEVKQLFLLVLRLLPLAMVSSIMGYWYIWKHHLEWMVLSPLRYIMLTIITIVCALSVGFNQLFIWFHQLLFSDNTWLFNPITDPIILVLPEPFFLLCFMIVFIGLLAGLFGIYRYYHCVFMKRVKQ